MAIENKRVIDLATESTSLAGDEYVLLDSDNTGTTKYRLSRLSDQIEDLNEAVQDEATAREKAVTELEGEITDLKDDLSDLESDGVVASAEQLLSDNYTIDQVPYHYRQSASGGADRAYDEIVGGSVVWNQLIQNSDFYTSETNNGITFTYNNDGSITVSGTATAFASVSLTRGQMSQVKDRVYFLAQPLGASQNTYFVRSGTNSFWNYKQISKGDTNGAIALRFVVQSGQTVNLTFKPQFHDLTAMFGTTIADNIYTLEQSSAGAGVAFFRKLFPNDYYEYDAGTLRSVEGVSAHIMKDADDNIIGNYSLDSSLTLRGIPKLDASNNLYYDGDTYAADGTVTRKCEEISLGSLAWSGTALNGDVRRFYTTPQYSKYTEIAGNGMYNSAGQNTNVINNAFINNEGRIIITPDFAQNITSIADFQTYLASNPKPMIAMLATTTTEQAEPYTNPQIVDPYGTEEYVTTSIVPVGHYTKYPENLKAKIENLDLSMIAPIETGTTASQEYAVGKYFLLNNQFCKAKTAIASGATFTLGTNYEVTTVAEELYTALNA